MSALMPVNFLADSCFVAKPYNLQEKCLKK